MEVIFYTIGCPACNVLKKKLDDKGIVYTVIDSIEEMQALGIEQLPQLQVDGNLMDYPRAVAWVNGR